MFKHLFLAHLFGPSASMLAANFVTSHLSCQVHPVAPVVLWYYRSHLARKVVGLNPME